MMLAANAAAAAAAAVVFSELWKLLLYSSGRLPLSPCISRRILLTYTNELQLNQYWFAATPTLLLSFSKAI